MCSDRLAMHVLYICLSSVAFMIATQFFYTLCFITALLGFGLVMFFFLCAGPDQKFFVRLIKVRDAAHIRSIDWRFLM